MINKVIGIAKEAGEIIREGFGKNFSFEYKTNESNIVTEIDQAAEKTIIDFVKKEFPYHSIIAEESGRKESASDYRWVIDPLDGTTNFAHGLPIFSVSIGVQKKGETIHGVVYDVMRDVLYAADRGAGSYANERRLAVTGEDKLARALVATGFPYDIAENPLNAIEILGEFLRTSRGIRRLGSAAIDFGYLAEGAFDSFYEVHLQPWDMCAGILIVTEAGGKVTDFTGKPADIFTPHVLSSNGAIHDVMLEVIGKFAKL